MDKKSKALSWIIALAVVASVGITFYKTVVIKNFEMVAEEAEEEIVEEFDGQIEEATGEIDEEGESLDSMTDSATTSDEIQAE